MNTVTHKVVLVGDQNFGRRLPPHHVGLLLSDLPLVIRQSVSMALRNRSTVRGQRPVWLDRAADVRFVDHQGNGETALFFEAPRLGDAAAEIYQQQELPGLSTRPSPEDTGFDLLGDVLTDVSVGNADSEHFDPPLLRRLAKFRNVFRRGPYREVDFMSRRYSGQEAARFTPATVESACLLLGRTPAPHRIRLVGTLDGIEASTQRFSILLDTGEKAVGLFGDALFDAVQRLWRQRVLVLGTAVYRASGRLLRIDAESVACGASEKPIWSRIPQPAGRRLVISRLHRSQGPRSGLAAIMGRWPGDETDEQIHAALERLS